LLYVGGEFLLRSAISISERIGISQFIIGLTVVALGTSLPELFVSVIAVVRNTPEIAIANIVGSNIINIALIIPIALLFTSIRMPKRLPNFDYPIMLISFLLIVALIIEWPKFPQSINFTLSRIDGGILLIALAGYFGYLIHSARKEKSKQGDQSAQTEVQIPIALVILMFLCGVSALAFGSNTLVSGATAIAASLGISTRIIALTIVAHGTNLPEIFTTIVALCKKETNIIIGNLIGSNVINTLFILGIIGVTTSLTLTEVTLFFVDLMMLIAISGYIFVILASAKKKLLLRTHHGALILVSYITYFTWILSRS